jgi:Flp pilus assembly protein TadG
MVELALCLLLALSLIYAVMEFGRVVYSYTVLNGATREASRYAIVHGSASGSAATQDTIRDQVTRWAIGLDASAIGVEATWLPSKAPGSTVRIVATYTINPFSGLLMRQPLVLASRSEMMISQ